MVGQGEDIGEAFLPKPCLGCHSKMRISQARVKGICDSPEAGGGLGKLGEGKG